MAESMLIQSAGGYQYIEKSDETALQLGGNARTIEFWLKIPVNWSTSLQHDIVSKFQVGSSAGYAVVGQNFGPNNFLVTGVSGHTNGGFVYLGGGGVAPNYPSPFNFGTWYHFAFTEEDAGGVLRTKSYLNGVLYSVADHPGIDLTIDTNVLPLRMGYGQDSPDVWQSNPSSNFVLDDVRLWNVARTAAQIAADKDHELVGNETGLVAYYKLNGDGTDSGPNGFDATAPQGFEPEAFPDDRAFEPPPPGAIATMVSGMMKFKVNLQEPTN